MAKVLFAVFAVVISTGFSVRSSAATCVRPPGFTDTPHPAVAPVDRLVSHSEEIIINRPLAVAVSAADKPLQDALHHPNSLPGVAGDVSLTDGEFGTPGSRRLVCLSDGSTLEEQALEREQDSHSYRFRYVVWNYTTVKARPIVYGVGEFVYSGMSEKSTRVHWTYAFELNRHRFPGYLGSVGDFLFRVGFLDRQYAELMRGTLAGLKTDAESRSVVDRK
jgi:hypothetical protein